MHHRLKTSRKGKKYIIVSAHFEGKLTKFDCTTAVGKEKRSLQVAACISKPLLRSHFQHKGLHLNLSQFYWSKRSQTATCDVNTELHLHVWSG